MKKLLALVLAVVMVLGLAACSKPAASTAAPTAAPTQAATQAADPAAAYPEKTAKVIIPFGAGGSTDLGGRVVVDGLNKSITGVKGNFIAENQAGGSAIPGTKAVLEGNDTAGYTLGYNWYASFNFRPQFMDCGYTIDDFTVICGMTIQCSSIVIRENETRFTDVESLIKYIEAHPDELNFSCGAANSWQLLIAMSFLNAYGVAEKVTEVPQASAAEARVQLEAGNLDFVLLETATFATEIKQIAEAGKQEGCGVKFICGFEDGQNKKVPGQPTIGELGHPEVAKLAANRLVLVGPKGMDSAVVKKISDTCEALCKDADFLKKSDDASQVIVFMSGADALAEIKSSLEPLNALMKQAGFPVK